MCFFHNHCSSLKRAQNGMSDLTSSPHNEPVAVTTVTDSAVTMSTNKTDCVHNQIIKLALTVNENVFGVQLLTLVTAVKYNL